MAVVRPRSSALVAVIAAFIDTFKRELFDGGASASATPAFTGTAPAAAEVDAVTGTGYATAGQVVTTTDNQTLTLNQLAGCWLLTATKAPCLIVSHPACAAAPAAFTVYGAAPATTAEGYRILRAPTPAGAVAAHTHGAGTLAAPIHYDRAEYPVTAAAASDLATSITLAQDLLEAYARHRVDALAHTAADATNVVASAPSAVVDLATAIVAANQMKAAYNAHRAEGGVHPTNDAGNATAAADAADQGTLNTLLNELKTDLNAHLADGLSTPSWRAVDV